MQQVYLLHPIDVAGGLTALILEDIPAQHGSIIIDHVACVWLQQHEAVGVVLVCSVSSHNVLRGCRRPGAHAQQ